MNVPVLIIFLISNLPTMASTMYLPSLPEIGQVFGSSESLMKLTLSVYLIGFISSQLASGSLSDRYGRRSILLIGTSLFCCGTLLCMLSPSISVFFCGRFIQGFGSCAIASLSRTILRDLFSGKELSKFNSYNGIILTLGIVLSPLFGAFFQDIFNWQFSFLFMLVYGSLGFLSIYKLFPETNSHLDLSALQFSNIFSSWKEFLTDRTFMANTIAAGMATSGIYVYYSITPFLFQNDFELTPVEYGYCSLFIVSTLIIGRMINIKLIHYKDLSEMMYFGNLCMVSSGLILILLAIFQSANIFTISLLVSLFLLGAAIVFSNSAAGALTPFPHKAGVAGAVYGFIQMLISFLVSLALAIPQGENILVLSTGLFVCGLLSFILYQKLVLKTAIQYEEKT
ncbi:MAG: multidrug effflux MFS transporter [Parachlamydiaceae bacterium]